MTEGGEPRLRQVWLVRHGETAWTVTGQHTGRTDIPLTTRGEDQARQLSTLLQGVPFTAVFTSPLGRARRTCELAGFGREAQPDADLMEWDYGAYEGRRTSDIRSERPGWQLFDDGCPGGETADAVAGRTDRMLAKLQQYQGNVLAFAHRDVLGVLTARWVLMPAERGRHFFLDTASLSILGYGNDLQDPCIRLWNEVPK
jgi:probable phosphoglycerate mutase